jgi:hypothetical protein
MIPHKAYPSESDAQVLIVLKSGKKMPINCSAEDYVDGVTAYRAGALIQDAFPMLNNEEREFLITGTTPKEWGEMPCMDCSKSLKDCRCEG